MSERRAVLSAAAFGIAATAGAAPVVQQGDARSMAGKAALVTGGARGIGRATALALARRGADIALLDIADPHAIPVLNYPLASRQDLEEAARLVRAEGVRALPLVADLRDPQAVQQAAQRTVAELGGIDILVANAGIGVDGTLQQITPAGWQALLDVNMTGTLHAIRAALPGLRRRPGARVIFVTSVQGRMGSAASGPYAATKWALTGMMKSLALELGPEGITVNAVAPTAVETVMLNRSEEERSQPDPRGEARRLHHALPVGALQPQEVAAAIAFLAGPGAEHISGVTLDVNAGHSAELTA